MNAKDEKIRNAVNDALSQANVDVRNLAIEVVDGDLIVKGTVPALDQHEQLALMLRDCIDEGLSLDFDVSVKLSRRAIA